MRHLLATLSAYLVATLPALAQETAPEQALEHAVDESVVEEVHQAHGGGGLPQFNPDTWASQIFWLAISFTILYVFFAKFILPSLTATIENREGKIKGDLNAARDLSKQAEKIRLEYEAELKNASKKAASDIKAIDDAAKAKTAQYLADFRKKFDTEVQSTESKLDASKGQALVEMQKIAAEIAAQAAEKIAGVPADQSQAESVVQSLKNKAA